MHSLIALVLGSLAVVQTSVSGSVPRGAQRVPFLSLAMTAGCDADVDVREVTVVHDGLGESADLLRVYATDGKRRLTRSRSIDASDRTATLRFFPELTVKACASKTIIIAADIAPDAAAAGEHTLSVELGTDVAVRLSVPEVAPVATVRPKSVGAVAVTFLDLLQPLRFGNSRTLARFRLEADGAADQEIHAITFTNDGKATDDDLRTLRVQNRRRETLTQTAASMDGDRVRLTFDPPLRLDRNDEILLELKGDVRASNRRTVRFTLEEASDLEALPRAR